MFAWLLRCLDTYTEYVTLEVLTHTLKLFIQSEKLPNLSQLKKGYRLAQAITSCGASGTNFTTQMIFAVLGYRLLFKTENHGPH